MRKYLPTVVLVCLLVVLGLWSYLGFRSFGAFWGFFNFIGAFIVCHIIAGIYVSLHEDEGEMDEETWESFMWVYIGGGFFTLVMCISVGVYESRELRQSTGAKMHSTS